jgi:AcrR family transcriptional regulator
VTPGEAAARHPNSSEATLERGRRRRTEIVDVAMQMFAADGYRGTGIGRIAAQVGVTQAGLLHHFGSKERLLEAVMERRDEQDAELLETIAGDGGMGLVDRLPMLADHNEQRPGLAQLFTVLVAENLLPEHRAHDYFVQRYRAFRHRLVQALRAGQERGEIRGDIDPHAVATRIVATLDGLQTQWLLDPERVSLRRVYEEYAQALRRELTG